MNSNQLLTLLKKGNDLQKEDFQQLVKLHESFPYFQIPAVLAAKYENKNQKDRSSELLHKAAILSPDRSWLRFLIENDILFLEEEEKTNAPEIISESPSVVIIDNQNDLESPEILKREEEIKSKKEDEKESEANGKKDQPLILTDEFNDNVIKSEEERNHSDTQNSKLSEISKSEGTETNSKAPTDKGEAFDEKITKETSSHLAPLDEQQKDNHSEIVSNSHPTQEDNPRPDLITSPFGGNEDTRPDLITSDSEPKTPAKDEELPKLVKPEEGDVDKTIIEPVPGPPSNRQQILKQLEDNLARLKSESNKNKPEEKSEEETKEIKPRRRRSGEDLIDSIKKKEKREIKDTKKKEQNDIIKAFNKKSIKLAAIKENEDANKLQDLSLPSTKINDRMVSESYAKLLTQQGKKAAAKEIYKKLILKFPQKKAYFADLIQQLEE